MDPPSQPGAQPIAASHGSVIESSRGLRWKMVAFHNRDGYVSGVDMAALAPTLAPIVSTSLVNSRSVLT